ncbi:TetR family transcriptional regulator C-terminal domain-containing protein [Myxococcus sp. CA051A]|uniref:TetR/AcrR family transcriptional regulator n=1 Tax=unclassified Myxococcus TaxID=2648731 RepID=UPI00157AE354|nr:MULTISPECIES: TetR/AcrR family transcriptional regulator [unclassified Myxococcus]NTX11685.1 TetR family transcriptional regulator C-terminal domain-containing protein [Myxococcus sp. CA056]NTX34218.1 TetR family transcriptional regulator C-terminal domain-containing protein [Myxococcus sp. CA033]NTX53139.1 TetR family transcriptional regulator C-terminal domain-containing protein [Myxococcus sp. CA039A]NTX60952.1 TetR family transcriptional regulator C-terminal domain-containing protein [My
MPRASVRDKLLAAGLETLRTQGFNGCGVQDITDAAGVPKGSFYNHFESKEALGAAVVDQYMRASSADLSLLRDTSLTPLRRLRAYFAAQVEVLVAGRFECGCLLANFAAELADHSPLIRERVAASFAEWSSRLEEVLLEAQGSGEVAKDVAPEMLATFMLGAWEGAVLRSRVEKGRAPLDAFLRLAFDRSLEQATAACAT